MTLGPLTAIADITTKVGSGSTPRGGSEAYKAEGIPLIRSMNVRMDGFAPDGLVYLDARQAAKLDGVTVRAGDVLLNITGASIGRVAVAPPEMEGARVNQHVCILRPTADVDPGFMRAFFASPEQQAAIFEAESGATRQALTKAKILAWELPKPPITEQRRIVARVEALTAKSRRAKEALDAIPPLLERFRQSVLAAAFRGDLTKDWREQHPDVEPADQLLARIRQERRHRWEQAELKKLHVQGKKPKNDDWKKKYVEPEPVDAEGLPGLPSGWCWASIGEVADVDGGLTKHAGKRAASRQLAPLVSVAAVQFRRIVVEEVGTIGLLQEDGSKATLARGDLLVVEGNGSIDQIGRVAIWSDEVVGARHQNHIIRVRPHLVDSVYVLEWLASATGRLHVVQQATSAAGLYNLSLSKVSRIPVPLAPLAEQWELLGAVRARTAPISTVHQTIEEGRTAAATLDAAILAKAFRGELVEPTDE